MAQTDLCLSASPCLQLRLTGRMLEYMYLKIFPLIPVKLGQLGSCSLCRRGQGESRVKSTSSAEMPDKITHTGPRHLRENCKLPINILHSHTTTIDAAGHSLLQENLLNSDQKLRKCKISYLMLDQCNKLAFYPHSDEINIH